MDWQPIISTIVGAGLGTALVQGAISLYQYHSTGNSAARYVAIRLATLFESYAGECLERMFEQENYMGSSGAIGRLYSRVPNFPEWPDDTDGWRRLRSDSMALAFELRANAERHQKKLQSIMQDLMDEDEAYTECQKSCAELGAHAFRLAASLRNLYGFPQSSTDIAGDIVDCVANGRTSFERMEGW
nr:hypothetical protein [uncultured Shinella sp.]